MNAEIYSLTVYDGKLCAGGYFTTAGGVAANGAAAWDGSSWSALVACLAIMTGDVNQSSSITSADVIGLVNYVFKGGAPPCDVCGIIPGSWSCPRTDDVHFHRGLLMASVVILPGKAG